MQVSSKRVLGMTVVVLLMISGYRIGGLYTRLVQPFRGYVSGERLIEIPEGISGAEIGRRLVETGVVSDYSLFRWALRVTGKGPWLQSGHYMFDRPMSATEVVRKIARGDVMLSVVTFPEGLRRDEMAVVFERSGLGTASEFMAAAADASLIADLDAEATDLEGYLFPDTYRVPIGTTARELVVEMIRRFEWVFSAELRRAAEKQGYTVRQVVTLASLVEKETARTNERRTVAGVYRNRLNIGMGLQCDPTVIYALQIVGLYDGNLTRANLNFDSPYNTYRYPGLPPGPIAAPGRASLEAAVNPAKVDYLFFVSRNDGSHAFARTLREHNRNVQTYQVRYFRERRRQRAQ